MHTDSYRWHVRFTPREERQVFRRDTADDQIMRYLSALDAAFNADVDATVVLDPLLPYALTAQCMHKAALLTVMLNGAPALHLGISAASANAGRLWLQLTSADYYPPRRPEPPWVLARFDRASLPMRNEMRQQLHDLEVPLAWAWFERRELRGPSRNDRPD
jgi:hypothetical protein